MKIAIVTDVHYGKNRNNPFLLKETGNFFRDNFFPTLKENGVTHIINAGDMFDARINLGMAAIDSYRETFEGPANELGIPIDHIIGNHDCLYESTNRVNSPKHIFKLNKVKIYETTTEIVIGGKKFLFVPWINQENHQHSLDMIANSDADYLIGHLQITGFDYGGTKSKGLEQALFKKYKLVMSGHFHKQQKIGNIYYLGSPMILDWGEIENEVGFHILDTETGQLEFIPNYDNNHFMRVKYQNGIVAPKNMEGKNIKVFHGIKESETDFERFVKDIQLQKPYDVTFVDETKTSIKEMINESVDEEIQTKDIPDIIVNYVDKLDDETISSEFKDEVKDLLLKVYKEARKR
ncbi:endonuclease subunit 1 [Ochrobactrum phage vB_OspM_OC]|nr:endonuclease subunit 1 [Ochrobactrum phage vB_OspM_OC]